MRLKDKKKPEITITDNRNKDITNNKNKDINKISTLLSVIKNFSNVLNGSKEIEETNKTERTRIEETNKTERFNIAINGTLGLLDSLVPTLVSSISNISNNKTKSKNERLNDLFQQQVEITHNPNISQEDKKYLLENIQKERQKILGIK